MLTGIGLNSQLMTHQLQEVNYTGAESTQFAWALSSFVPVLCTLCIQTADPATLQAALC